MIELGDHRVGLLPPVPPRTGRSWRVAGVPRRPLIPGALCPPHVTRRSSRRGTPRTPQPLSWRSRTPPAPPPQDSLRFRPDIFEEISEKRAWVFSRSASKRDVSQNSIRGPTPAIVTSRSMPGVVAQVLRNEDSPLLVDGALGRSREHHSLVGLGVEILGGPVDDVAFDLTPVFEGVEMQALVGGGQDRRLQAAAFELGPESRRNAHPALRVHRVRESAAKHRTGRCSLHSVVCVIPFHPTCPHRDTLLIHLMGKYQQQNSRFLRVLDALFFGTAHAATYMWW